MSFKTTRLKVTKRRAVVGQSRTWGDHRGANEAAGSARGDAFLPPPHRHPREQRRAEARERGPWCPGSLVLLQWAGRRGEPARQCGRQKEKPPENGRYKPRVLPHTLFAALSPSLMPPACPSPPGTPALCGHCTTDLSSPLRAPREQGTGPVQRREMTRRLIPFLSPLACGPMAHDCHGG